MRRALQILLESPELVANVGELDSLRNLSVPGVPLLLEVVELLQSRSGLTAATVFEHWRGREEQRHLAKLVAASLAVEPTAEELSDCLQRLRASASGERLQVLHEKFVHGQLSDAEKNEYLALQRKR